MALENLEVTPEVTPEDPKYVEEMAAKGAHAVEGGLPAEEGAIPPKPEEVPDKFYDAETGKVDYTALAKSYVELEKLKAAPKDKEESKDDSKKEPEADKEASKEDEAAKVVEGAGLDMSTLASEYATDGKLSDASYEALEKVGIDRSTVDAHIEGREAVNAVRQAEAHTITGDGEGYQAMVEWAVANATPEEIADYNEAVNSKNATIRQAAVKGMFAQYQADAGESGGKLITAKGNGKTTEGAYQSRAEMMADMSDPKYAKDEAFRAKVQNKLARSNIM